ncbi:hypothetical protein BHM03_00041072 [Ensete ventricosum]|nr:hypothetical protein BHM03_00041072 [Ensete ventricosum]
MAETRLDVLEASVEELYQGQGRLLGVESSQEEAETRIENVESLIDQLIEDTKDFIRHLHEVMAKLTAKPPVGCKCKLARKLLEPLMRSAVVNKMSVKLGILHKGRRRHLERQPGRRATERDLQWRKLALMFLKRAWRNSTKAKEGYLG